MQYAMSCVHGVVVGDVVSLGGKYGVCYCDVFSLAYVYFDQL